jgi:putative flavoprotein involved in K+ transport
MAPEQLDVVVIGAGQAGLAASFELQRAAVAHVVLERGRIGETWRSQRWDSFRLNTPNWMNLLPGETEALEPRDGFVSQDAFVGHLEAYAERFDLPVRTQASVESVESDPSGRGFLITVASSSGGGPEQLAARAVVLASGAQRVPRIPPLAAELPRGLFRLASAEYRKPDALPPGAVLVVGSGQSGLQIVEDLLAAERTVYLCTSRVARMPRRYRGRDVMAWLVDIGFFDQRPTDLPDPALQYAAQPAISGVGPLGHTVSLQALAARGVTLLGRPRAVRDGRLTLDDSVAANVAFGDERSAATRDLIDAAIQRLGWTLPPLDDDPADAPHPDPSAISSPPTVDLARAGISTVIWATGVTGEFAWLRVPGALDASGLPVHHDGVSSVPGLYFIGLPWLSRRKSGIVLGVGDDAAEVIAHLRGRLGAR